MAMSIEKIGKIDDVIAYVTMYDNSDNLSVKWQGLCLVVVQWLHATQ